LDEGMGGGEGEGLVRYDWTLGEEIGREGYMEG
jgi:hypothetical protein